MADFQAATAPSGALPGVLHVLAPQFAGGLERAVELMAGGMAARGHRVSAVLFLDPAGEPPPLAGTLESAGVAVTLVRAPARFYWREARALAEALRASRAGIVHTHGYRGNVLAYRPARAHGAALVSTAHGYTGNDLKNRVYEWLDRRALRRFDAVIAVSVSLRDQLIRSGVNPARIHVVQNGIGDLQADERLVARQALGVSTQGRLVGWIGRMTREKGADLLVEALKPVAGVRADIVLVGDGPEHPALERYAGPGFRFLGRVRDASRYLKAFDVVVLSSRTEGTPMVLLEAMQAGVPVVAFGVGGIPAVLSESTGWIIPPGDLARLRSAVLEALDDAALAARRVEAARTLVAARFGLESWLDRIEAVYSEVVRASR